MALPSLYEIAQEYRQQAGQLADLDLDDATLADTLESIQWPIEEKARAVAAVIGNMDAAASMVKEFSRRKSAEAAATQARADRLRAYLLENMLACQITEIKSIDGSLTIRTKQNPASVVITDAGSIPSNLYTYPEAPAPYPNKLAIKAAIDAGEHIDGARLERGVRLEIK